MQIKLLALLILTATLAGCFGADDTPEHPDMSDNNQDNGQNNQGDEQNNESMPVNLSLEAAGNNSMYYTNTNITINYTLTGGDEASFEVYLNTKANQNFTAEGNNQTITGNFTINTATPGNHTIEVFATFNDNRSASASLEIAIMEPEPEPRSYPEVMNFTFGESLGCAGDVLQLAGGNCISAMEGPDASGIDGFWVHLGGNYTGLAFTATVQNALGDSDCFFTDENLNMTGEANNGGGPCEGVLPANVEWLFLYSYGEASLGQTLTFLTEE